MYNFVDAHALEDAVSREEDEVVGSRVDVVGNNIRDAAQEALGLSLHSSLVVLHALFRANHTLY